MPVRPFVITTRGRQYVSKCNILFTPGTPIRPVPSTNIPFAPFNRLIFMQFGFTRRLMATYQGHFPCGSWDGISSLRAAPIPDDAGLTGRCGGTFGYCGSLPAVTNCRTPGSDRRRAACVPSASVACFPARHDRPSDPMPSSPQRASFTRECRQIRSSVFLRGFSAVGGISGALCSESRRTAPHRPAAAMQTRRQQAGLHAFLHSLIFKRGTS